MIEGLLLKVESILANISVQTSLLFMFIHGISSFISYHSPPEHPTPHTTHLLIIDLNSLDCFWIPFEHMLLSLLKPASLNSYSLPENTDNHMLLPKQNYHHI